MTQLGAFLFKKLAATSQAMFLTRVEVLTPELANGATRYYVNKGINQLNKKFASTEGLGITLTNNEIKDTTKVIRYLGNGGILLKRTVKKITV